LGPGGCRFPILLHSCSGFAQLGIANHCILVASSSNRRPLSGCEGVAGSCARIFTFSCFFAGISRQGRAFGFERENTISRARAIGQGEGRVPLYLFCFMNFRTLTMWISFITYPDDKHRHG
jgi:hypothetical protein